jgi:hypothetical protein
VDGVDGPAAPGLHGHATRGRAGGRSDGAPPAPLQHALPTRLSLNPSNMLAMRDSFFGPAAAPPALAVQAFGQSVGADMEVEDGGWTRAGQGEAAGVGGGLALPHAWRRSPSPLLSTPGKLGRGLARAGAGAEGPESIWGTGEDDLMGGAAPEPLPLGSPSPASARARARFGAAGSTASPGGTAAPAATHVAEPSALLVDAGLCMGRAFRASWGPNGTLLIPGEAVLPK